MYSTLHLFLPFHFEVLCNLISKKKISGEDTNVNFNTFASKLIEEMFFPYVL